MSLSAALERFYHMICDGSAEWDIWSRASRREQEAYEKRWRKWAAHWAEEKRIREGGSIFYRTDGTPRYMHFRKN